MNATSSAEIAHRPRRKWLYRLLILVGILILSGILLAALAFVVWFDFESMSEAEALAAFTAARAEIGAGPAYVEARGATDFVLRHELEPAAPAKIRRLRVLAWVPEKGKLLRADLPFWFLAWKSNATLGLDEVLNDFAAEASGRVRVSAADLRRRGPGLYLDWETPEAQVLLWGEPE